MPPNPRDPGPAQPRGLRAIGWLLLFLLLLLPALWMGVPEQNEGVYEVSYTRFKTLVEQGEVVEVTLRGDEAEGRLKQPLPIGPAEKKGDRFRTRIPDFASRPSREDWSRSRGRRARS